MKNRFLAGVLWGLLLPLTGFSGYEAYSAITAITAEQRPDQEASVFLVECPLSEDTETSTLFGTSIWGQGFGSAFLVERKDAGIGLITAWHVLVGESMPVSVHGATESLAVTFTQIGKSDLGWAPLTEWPKSWKILKQGHVKVGESVNSWGFPDAEGLQGYPGKVRILQGVRIPGLFYTEGDYIGLDAQAIPGMSGGPVLNSEGEAVAVVVVRMNSGKIRSFAVQLPD
jgi:S1-C subfamily serine protease